MSLTKSVSKCILILLAVAVAFVFITSETSYAISDTSVKYIPKGGKLYAKVWRTTGDGKVSGNSKKWNYLVSASYKGSQRVTAIRCTWRSSAALRKSATISIGISGAGGSASASSKWQTVKSKKNTGKIRMVPKNPAGARILQLVLKNTMKQILFTHTVKLN